MLGDDPFHPRGDFFRGRFLRNHPRGDFYSIGEDPGFIGQDPGFICEDPGFITQKSWI